MRIESCTEGRSQTAAYPISEYRRGTSRWKGVLGGFFVYRAAILDRFFVKVMSYEMEHSFLRNDLD